MIAENKHSKQRSASKSLHLEEQQAGSQQTITENTPVEDEEDLIDNDHDIQIDEENLADDIEDVEDIEEEDDDFDEDSEEIVQNTASASRTRGGKKRRRKKSTSRKLWQIAVSSYFP